MTRPHLLPGLLIGLSVAIGIATPLFAETAPASMGADARVRSVLYNPVDVIRLDTQMRVNTDAFGNHRTYFALPSTHNSLRVKAQSVVNTRTVSEADSPMSWEEVRTVFGYKAGVPGSLAAGFVFGLCQRAGCGNRGGQPPSPC